MVVKVRNACQLEINHAEKYFLNRWNDRTLTASQADVELRQAHDQKHFLALREHVKRPTTTYGRPIGCPMGFDPTPITEDEYAKNNKDAAPSVIERYLTAFVNEAYDRNII